MIANQLLKIAKQLVAFDDYDLIIEAKESLIDLIKDNKVTQVEVKKIIQKYHLHEFDLLIDELDEFSKFNGRYSSGVNKVIKMLERI